MAETFGSILLLGFCILISRWEYYRFGTFVTPFGAMAWPYTIVVLMINLAGRHFGFYSVSLQSVIFMMIGFIFFLLGSILYHLVIFREEKKMIYEDDKKEVIRLFDYYRPLFIFLAIVSIFAGLIHFFQCINQYGYENIWQMEFRTAYGTGALSHVIILSRPAFIFLFADYILKKKKSILFLLLFMLIIVFMRQSKYHIFGLILGGYFFSIFHNLIRFSYKKIMGYVLIVFILFVATYYIGFFAVGSDYALAQKTNIWLMNLFFTYLFGGPIGFSEILNNTVYPLYSAKEIIAVPINLIKFICGEKNFIDIIIRNWIPVSDHYDMFHSSNIFGMVGMLYMYLGLKITFLVLYFLGFSSYSLLGIANRSKNFISAQLIYAFIMCYLTVSFFDLYFNKLPVYEAIAFMLFFPILYDFLRKFFKFIVIHYSEEMSKNRRITIIQ